jgi:hypothetical protein|tara:strand:+ start:264 stop:485 length:222 start_codon:yes stop_codon:yes gene_type:complete
MTGMLFVRLMESSSTWSRRDTYKEKTSMIKKIQRYVAYIPLIPVIVIEWIIWPVAKVHSGLNGISQWLRRVGQ